MLLKVGELAKRTGLTVRTLHHYDSIGVLSPSERSDAGYRLYNRDDVARLHAIQALRQIGLPLNEISALLEGKPEPLPLIIQRQIVALDHQIAQAGELRARLGLLQSSLNHGHEPDLADWLSMLASMSTYGKNFSAAELKSIFENWRLTESSWHPLIADIRAAMQRKIAPERVEIQALARRWMDLSVRWMKGDFELMERWQKMYLQEPAAQGKNGADLALVEYINQAVALRVQALLTFFSQSELQSLNVELEDEWTALAGLIDKLMQQDVPLKGKKAQAALALWHDLVDRTVGRNPVLREKFLRAFGTDPLLAAGSILGPERQDYIRRVLASVP